MANLLEEGPLRPPLRPIKTPFERRKIDLYHGLFIIQLFRTETLRPGVFRKFHLIPPRNTPYFIFPPRQAPAFSSAKFCLEPAILNQSAAFLGEKTGIFLPRQIPHAQRRSGFFMVECRRNEKRRNLRKIPSIESMVWDRLCSSFGEFFSSKSNCLFDLLKNFMTLRFFNQTKGDLKRSRCSERTHKVFAL